jgi:predicted RNase H-like nuclease
VTVRLGGVDGCRGGWVLVTTGLRPGSPTTVEVLATFAEIVDRVKRGDLDRVGVDMSIGLPASGRRACDGAARARLGARRSSVFPTPPRPLLSVTDYAEALARSRAIDGRGLSKQAFFLLPKMAEVDAAITPGLQSAIFECHPESCFATLAGAPLSTPKRSAAGQAERAALLSPAFGDGLSLAFGDGLSARPKIDPEICPRFHPAGAAADDVLDAFAVAEAARRHHRGTAVVLGDGALDARGLRMEIIV